MADILIRGLEMPKVCIEGGWYGNCPLDRLWCAKRFAPEGITMGEIRKEQHDNLPSWCPLVPLPEGHGRLGDLDALACSDEVKRKGCAYQEEIFRFPTIVPAEGGTDNG